MRANPWLLGVTSLLATLVTACIPTRATYYEPTAGADGRNATLCTLGVRNQSEIAVAPGVIVRINGGDAEAQAASLSATVALLVHEGRRVQFGSDTFTLASESPEQAYRITPEFISTSCHLEPPTCATRLASTDVLEGRTWRGSGLIPAKEPRVFWINLVAAAPAPDAFTVQLPPLLVDGTLSTLPVVRFQKVSKTTVEGICQ